MLFKHLKMKIISARKYSISSVPHLPFTHKMVLKKTLQEKIRKPVRHPRHDKRVGAF